MVKAALPVLLEHAPLRTQGEAWLTLAKCDLHEVRRHSTYDLSRGNSE
jgi:hypothetical protein